MDADNAELLAGFWRAAVGCVDEPPPLPFKDRREWIRSFGEDIADDEPLGGAWLIDPRGVAPRLSILPVPEPKVAKNRQHMDLAVSTNVDAEERWSEVEAEVQRLIGIGATVMRREVGHHVVLADRDGNEFCVA